MIILAVGPQIQLYLRQGFFYLRLAFHSLKTSFISKFKFSCFTYWWVSQAPWCASLMLDKDLVYTVLFNFQGSGSHMILVGPKPASGRQCILILSSMEEFRVLQNPNEIQCPTDHLDFYTLQAVYHCVKSFGSSEIIIHFKLTLPSVRIDDSSRVMRLLTGKEAIAESNQQKTWLIKQWVENRTKPAHW